MALLGIVNQIKEFIEIKVSFSRSSIPRAARPSILFPLSGICTGDGRGRIYLRANKRVGEREGKTGPGEIKASAGSAHICIAPFVTCIIHVHNQRSKNQLDSTQTISLYIEEFCMACSYYKNSPIQFHKKTKEANCMLIG